MAGLLKNILGGSKSDPPVSAGDDSDFADFAGAPDPSPASHVAPSFTGLQGSSATPVPYTAWYRVWERTSPSDFQQEAYIIPFVLLIVFINTWGKRSNRKRAKKWMNAHAPALESEFAKIGFGGYTRNPQADDVQSSGLLQATQGHGLEVPEEALKEVSGDSFISYATGRQNTAFADIKINLFKRYNPLVAFLETVMSFFFESVPAPEERVEITIYAFDGKEKDLLQEAPSVPNSTYDGFVWAVVHKDIMKRMRDDRYDLSLTSTKDHNKLPPMLAIMSESAEVTDALLTPELLQAIEQAGEDLEALIVSDQPLDQPKKLDDTVPKKRISLALRYPSNPNGFVSTMPLFKYLLRMPDHLVKIGHFRPEALRRIRATREEEARKIRRLDEEEKAEERKATTDREKKEKRDQLLKGMKAEDQRKFLDKEREKEMRKGQKRKTMKA